MCLPRRYMQSAIKIVAACAVLAGATASFDVYADVWVWVDTDGVAHFAPERVDARYELFYKSPNLAKAGATATKEEAPARPADLKDFKPKLANYFANSPHFRQILPTLKDASRTYRVDLELLQSIIAAESAFDTNAVSSKGAVGLMQIMPDTARRFGVDSDRLLSVETKLTDPKLNIFLGARYLRLLMDMFPGRLDLAIASYNAGEGAVQKAGNAIPNFKETQNYVATVTQIYAALKPPPPVAPRASTSPSRDGQYGSGFVLTAPRDPYALVLPAQEGATTLNGPTGRANMIAPLRTPVQTPVQTDTTFAVE